MNGKMIVGIALIAGIVAVVFLAGPIQAYVNGTDNRYLLQTQQRHRLRTQDCGCPQDSGCTQYRERQRLNQCATERIRNCTMNLEQYKYKNIERTRSQGH